MDDVRLLDIKLLRFSPKKRRGISPHRVEELRYSVESGRDTMPIRVHALADGTYVVRDGRHRIQAYLEAGIELIEAVVDNIGRGLERLLRLLLPIIPARLRPSSFFTKKTAYAVFF